MNEFLPHITSLLAEVSSGLSMLIPQLALLVSFLMALLVDLFYPGKHSRNTFFVALLGLSISMLLIPVLAAKPQGKVLLFGNTLVIDHMSYVLNYVFYGIIILFLLMVRNNSRLNAHKKGLGDLYLLTPAIALGLNFMAMSSSLLLMFVSIELISLASYLLVAYTSAEKKQSEAAMKYVLFGSACSAIMLYGISLLYGFTGTLNISDPAFSKSLASLPAIPLTLALSFFLVGIGFKLSFVPMHFWSPDVYEGAPTPVTAFLSAAPKVAAFVMLYRVYINLAATSGNNPAFQLQQALSFVAILSMVMGNFVALLQKNVKRMLAYSSIGHTGVLLMPLIAGGTQAYHAFLFYLIIYAIMNMAAFMLADMVEEQSGAISLDQYRGLGQMLKTEMLCFVLVLVSLTGLPPLAGFISKFLIFSALIESYSVSHSVMILVLLIVALISTVVSLFYYIKIPLNAYLRKAETPVSLNPGPRSALLIIVLLTVSLLLFGLFPHLLGV